MTSENELNPVETKEETKNSVEQVNNEQKINIEKPKRPGRKKRDVSSTEDINHVNTSDTQPLFEQPIIVEGKRSRKPTSRLEISELATPKKELSIPQGQGKPLGDIGFVNYQLTNASTDALSRIHNICFGRRGNQTNLRKNLYEFKGFEFERNSEEYQRHLKNLSKFSKEQLSSISDIFGQTSDGQNEEHAERILNFLLKPVDEGKTIPEGKISINQLKKAEKSNLIDDDDENFKNGDDDDDEDFNDEESIETDDDYLGSDDESGLNTRDDPDDFVYQPGKKTPKKRRRSGTTQRKKRSSSTKNKRGRKKSRIILDEPIESEEKSFVNEQIETNSVETKTDEHNDKDTKLSESNEVVSNNKK